MAGEPLVKVVGCLVADPTPRISQAGKSVGIAPTLWARDKRSGDRSDGGLLWFDCRAYNFGLRGVDRLAHNIAPQLVDALENAPAEPEWEWGYAGDTLIGVHSATK